jgi:hypothetical protein
MKDRRLAMRFNFGGIAEVIDLETQQQVKLQFGWRIDFRLGRDSGAIRGTYGEQNIFRPTAFPRAPSGESE